MTFQATCSVSPTDKITAYVPVIETADGKPLFAVVVESTWGNKQEKGSVVLTREDAMRLHAELEIYLKISHEAAPSSYSAGLCPDEGCPHHGKPHVCLTRVQTEKFVK